MTSEEVEDWGRSPHDVGSILAAAKGRDSSALPIPDYESES